MTAVTPEEGTVTASPDYTATFDDGYVDFARLAPRLWNPMGEHLVTAAAPAPGERVLDVCCGTGASALPAAHRVGPDGVVDAVDRSAGLLSVGRAAATDLPWLRFALADVTTWTGDAPYDLVQCGYGVFFLPDMDADSRRLVGLLRPGGRFAVLTWRRDALAAYTSCLLKAVEHVRGEPLPRPATAEAWSRIHTPADLTTWLTTTLGLTDVTAAEVDHPIPLDGTTAWDFVLGTGMRAMLTGLTDPQIADLRAGLTDRLTAAAVHHIDAGSVIGTGVLPHAPA